MNLQHVGGTTLGVRIAEQLRTNILNGEVAPGMRLTEQGLAEKLGVSRGPLREALLKLTEEGLLIKEAYKGIRVRQISEREVEELYSLRTNLEQFAFRTCWDLRDEAGLADLRQRLDDLTQARRSVGNPEVIDLEIRFHCWIFEFSDHVLLQTCWQNLIPLLRMYLSIHRKRFGPEGVFARENEVYARIAHGSDLQAMLDHVSDHMRLGVAEVIRSLRTSS